MAVNYETIDNDIEVVNRLKGTYDMDSCYFYESLQNVIEYAKEQRELDR